MRQTLFVIVIALIVILSLTGSQCVVVVSSGNGHSDKDKHQDGGLIVITGEGRFIDAPVQGIGYASGSVAGITGANGEFQYELGRTIRFSIGDIPLGEPTQGKPIITPLDLVRGGTVHTPAVINIARLLQSLDESPGDDRITIPVETSQTAGRSNRAISAAVESLDFGDEAAYVNAASQLIAVLTASYPFTAVLVDRESAHRHLVSSLAQLGISEQSTADTAP